MPETRYSTVGARTIAGRLAQLGFTSSLSLASIQRILRAAGLTQPVWGGRRQGLLPLATSLGGKSIQATDIITRHLRGGAVIENFHTIDHFSHAVWLGQYRDQTAAITRQFLLENWTQLGLPHLHQFDNVGAFSGGHTHPRVLGQVVRLCLFCGIEPLFTPFYDAQRN
jgi:putative transposase